MIERRSSQFYPDPNFLALMLAIAGFTVLLLGLSGCDAKSPKLIKEQDALIERCRAECEPYVINEFATGFSGDCRCTSERRR